MGGREDKHLASRWFFVCQELHGTDVDYFDSVRFCNRLVEMVSVDSPAPATASLETPID